jgi:transcriptional regulator with XRE-family HTH domain
MTLAERVSHNIAETRRRAGLSQMQFIERVSGLTQPGLSRLESGRQLARLSTLVKIARGLEVPVAELLAGIE